MNFLHHKRIFIHETTETNGFLNVQLIVISSHLIRNALVSDVIPWKSLSSVMHSMRQTSKTDIFRKYSHFYRIRVVAVPPSERMSKFQTGFSCTGRKSQKFLEKMQIFRRVTVPPIFLRWGGAAITRKQ